MKILCFLDFDTTFQGRSECVRAQAFLRPLDLSVNSSNDSGRSRKRSSESRLPFTFFGWVIGSVSRQFPGAGSSLRSVAGLESVLDESCGNDVEDELVPELDDNPGTTRDTKLSVLHFIVFPSSVNRGF